MNVIQFPLIDGSLIVAAATERLETVQRMAQRLIADGVPLDDKRRCVACLLRNGFHSLKVALLVDDARALAFQDLVAAEMADG